MEVIQCPKCGCKEIGKGILGGYAKMKPVGKIFRASDVIADVCTECGHILEMKVSQPEEFKGKY